MPIKYEQQQQPPHENGAAGLIEMLDSIPLNSFNKSQRSTKSAASSPIDDNHIAKAQSRLTEKKASAIRKLLKNPKSVSAERYLAYLQKYASNGGLIREEFRLEVWPLLAENLQPATHLDDDARGSSSTHSIITSNYLSIPNGNATTTAANSRTCSESEIYESARSSVTADEDSGEETASSSIDPTLEELQRHAEWNQVELDVNRTLARFPPNISEVERRQLQSDLTPMIVELLHRNDSFHYYQGFHDVCLTLMLALDVERAKKVARHLVEKGAFRNYLTKSLEESALRELQLMYVILHKCDPQLEKRLRHAELGTLFALSWPITWFSHALQSFDQIVLCFDLFLSSHPLMPIYVCAALVEHRRKEIMEVEAEMPVLHHLLNHIPADIDIEAILQRARELYNEYLPGMIQGQFLADYEDLCEFEGRRNLMPQANTLRRRSVLQNPLVVSGVAVAGVALYWWLSSYQEGFTLL